MFSNAKLCSNNIAEHTLIVRSKKKRKNCCHIFEEFKMPSLIGLMKKILLEHNLQQYL